MIFTILLIPLIAVGISRAMMSLPLPNFKPFNCQSCLSFWISAFLLLSIDVSFYLDVNMIGVAFISYLLSDLILIYESKG